MIYAVVGLVIGLFIGYLLYEIYFIKQQLEEALNDIYEIDQIVINQNIHLAKLLYHKAKDLEEYEACVRYKKLCPHINFYKIFDEESDSDPL